MSSKLCGKPSKLLEKGVHFQMISHLDDNGYLSFNQHGFCKGKSTSTAILELTRLLTDRYKSYRWKHTSCVFIKTLLKTALLRRL